MEISLIFALSAFFAGLLTFLAPCTLPLVPAYLGFISGVDASDFDNPETAKRARKRIFWNGAFFILGFTIVFVVFGLLVGLLGSAFAQYQTLLTRIGGVFVIFFGLFMLGAVSLPALQKERRFNIATKLSKGNTGSSLLIGGAFAVGWTPCIGPVLGSILLLAGSTSTALDAGFLLFIFSLGLSVPFLLVAFFFSRATKYIQNITKYLNVVSGIGGVFLILLGILLVTDQFALLLRYGFEFFDFLGYSKIQEFL